ncbi:MAG TPA: HAD family hydrolase, partial [Rectinemataceae bacterium]|nr:HAD family hydrolase [Rectinemataceae bacterium]
EAGRVQAYRTSEYIKDMGTPERLDQVARDLTSGVVAARRLSRRQRAVFLDRDGTINRYVELLHRSEDLELLPGAAAAIRSLNASPYLCFVVSNQPVVARNLCSIEEVEETHRRLETLLGAEGAYLDDIRFCPHHPDSGYPGENPAYKIKCACRKPGTGMIEELAAAYNVDLSRSWMVGDTSMDIQTAVNAGMRSILVASGMRESPAKYAARPELHCADLAEAVDRLLGQAEMQ